MFPRCSSHNRLFIFYFSSKWCNTMSVSFETVLYLYRLDHILGRQNMGCCLTLCCLATRWCNTCFTIWSPALQRMVMLSGTVCDSVGEKNISFLIMAYGSILNLYCTYCSIFHYFQLHCEQNNSVCFFSNNQTLRKKRLTLKTVSFIWTRCLTWILELCNVDLLGKTCLISSPNFNTPWCLRGGPNIQIGLLKHRPNLYIS